MDDTYSSTTESPNGRPEYQRPIFQVHDSLRKVNEKAYEPEIVSIGPYHWGKKGLSMMEGHKWRYLNGLIDVRKRNYYNKDYYYELSTEFVLGDLKNQFWETAMEARKKYDEPFPDGLKENNTFVDMLILDGCFIVGLLIKNCNEEWIAEDDPIFKADWMRSSLQRDLMLIENQLPFTVLCELFDLIIVGTGNHHLLANYACHFFYNVFHGLNTEIRESFEAKDVEHLLDLIHMCWNPDYSPQPVETDDDNKEAEYTNRGIDLESTNTLSRSFFSAKRIIENGVVFENTEGSLFDIEFKGNKVKFQQLVIERRTEAFFGNFIAYEQYFKATKGNYVTDYVNFLGHLIDSAEDVELLCHHRMLDNKLDDSKFVADFFRQINESVIENNPDNSSPYAQVYHQINVHCNKKINYWKAKFVGNILQSLGNNFHYTSYL